MLGTKMEAAALLLTPPTPETNQREEARLHSEQNPTQKLKGFWQALNIDVKT